MDFKYPLTSSHNREDYILGFVEKELVEDVIKVKAIIDTVLAVVVPKQEIIDTAVTSIKNYYQMALPSSMQTDKIEDISKINKDELKAIKDRLSKASKNK